MVEKHNFEVNPLQCPRCQGRMRVIAFIEDDFALRDIIKEHLGRRLECECQVLYDERELRRQALKRQFGIDFESGEVGLVD